MFMLPVGSGSHSSADAIVQQKAKKRDALAGCPVEKRQPSFADRRYGSVLSITPSRMPLRRVSKQQAYRVDSRVPLCRDFFRERLRFWAELAKPVKRRRSCSP